MTAAARDAAEAVLAAAVRYHSAEAAKEDLIATSAEGQVTARQRDHQRVTATNDRNRVQREALVAATGRDRARVEHNRAVRTERAGTMAPEEVAHADRARDALLEDLARQRQAARWAELARQAAERGSSYGLDRGGPGFGL